MGEGNPWNKVGTERESESSSNLSFELCSSFLLVEWKGQAYRWKRKKSTQSNFWCALPSNRSQPSRELNYIFLLSLSRSDAHRLSRCLWYTTRRLSRPSAPCQELLRKPGKSRTRLVYYLQHPESFYLFIFFLLFFSPCELWRLESNVERPQLLFSLILFLSLFPIWLIGRYWRIHRRLGGRRWRGFYTSQWYFYFFWGGGIIF